MNKNKMIPIETIENILRCDANEYFAKLKGYFERFNWVCNAHSDRGDFALSDNNDTLCYVYNLSMDWINKYVEIKNMLEDMTESSKNDPNHIYILTNFVYFDYYMAGKLRWHLSFPLFPNEIRQMLKEAQG